MKLDMPALNIHTFQKTLTSWTRLAETCNPVIDSLECYTLAVILCKETIKFLAFLCNAYNNNIMMDDTSDVNFLHGGQIPCDNKTYSASMHTDEHAPL